MPSATTWQGRSLIIITNRDACGLHVWPRNNCEPHSMLQISSERLGLRSLSSALECEVSNTPTRIKIEFHLLVGKLSISIPRIWDLIALVIAIPHSHKIAPSGHIKAQVGLYPKSSFNSLNHKLTSCSLHQIQHGCHSLCRCWFYYYSSRLATWCVRVVVHQDICN